MENVTRRLFPGELSPELAAELEALEASSDDDVDTSDIPELPEGWFAKAERGRFYRPTVGHIAVRPDILQWLGGNDHAAIARADAILRDAMERARAEAEPNDHPRAAE